MSAVRARVLVTRPVEQAAELAERLTEAGYEPVVVPTVVVEPLEDMMALDAALRNVGAYRWVILASATAAQLLVRRLAATQVNRDALADTVLVTGPAGGRALEAVGLRARGAVVDEVSVYRTVPVDRSDELDEALRLGISVVTFFSPSAVRGFVAAVGCGGGSLERALSGAVVACLGETTAREARAHGLRVDVVPVETTAAALVEGLVKAMAVRREMVWLA